MPSKTDIANIALAKFREGRITSIDDTTDSVAIIVKDQFEHCLRTVLEEHRWNFAGKRATLTQLVAAPEFGWTYQYQLPTDLIRLKEVNGELHEASLGTFTIEGDLLLSNEPTIAITYVGYVDDPNLFSPSFVDAMSFKLASLLCARITGNADLATSLDKQYQVGLSRAILLDAKAMGSNEKNLMQRQYQSSAIMNLRLGSHPLYRTARYYQNFP